MGRGIVESQLGSANQRRGDDGSTSIWGAAKQVLS